MPLLGGGGGAKTGKNNGDVLSTSASTAESSGQSPEIGKTDLLLRFFDSQFFDEWIALTYLYKSTSDGVQDYLCNRLYTLPEKGLERYLSQLCQLIINQPRSSLERVMVDLCARSLRIAVKVYWLLLAISQDRPKTTYVAELRDQCERAALEGYWEPPFRDPKLLPMSPPRARWLVGSPRSPIGNGLAGSSFRNRNGNGRSVGSRFGSPHNVTSPPRSRTMERPTSPDSLGGDMYSSYSLGQGLEGLICASPSAVRAALRSEGLEVQSADSKLLSAERRSRRRLRVENGDGEQALLDGQRGEQPSSVIVVSDGEADGGSPPSSPRLRQTTFGATLDFIEALCDASSGLTAFAPEDRQWALRKGLEEINKEIEHASKMGVACWFPMGTRNDRIVRLAAREAVLLNSRDKAPFMLIVEVLGEAAADKDKIAAAIADESEEGSPPKGVESRSSQDRLESHASAGPGPGSVEKGSLNSGPSLASLKLDESSMPESSPGSKSVPGTIKAGLASLRSKDKEKGQATTPRKIASPDSFSRGLNTAMVGLQGGGPLISLELEVLNPVGEYSPAHSEPSSSSASSFDHIAPGQNRSFRSQPNKVVGVIHEDDDVPFSPPKGTMGLLCTWGVCRGKPEVFAGRANEPYVKVHLKVHGGVDLRLNTKAHPSHRRVPSDEAILRMAAQQRVRNLDPRLLQTGSGPLPDSATPLRTSHSTPNPSIEAATPPPQPDVAPQEAMEAKVMESEGKEAKPMEEREPPGESAAERKQAEASAVFGERFWKTRERIKVNSPHGRRPGWSVTPIIVKSGDDCRQELLAAQLIEAFHDIFQESQLPLYLRPYEVLVTSNRTALIEMVPDTLSLHQLKAKSPIGTSLADHFFAKYIKGTPGCEAAQRNFAESMAAYSIVCYLLQIKDRHNGNILLDDVGHLIHIDFGFMLSNSPGGVNFEAAPFKLTRELLEVLDSNAEGRASEMFDYFKVLCIQGFLACRKHADRVILLVEMMQNSGCPCFKAGPRAVTALRKRFHLNLPESQCVEVVLGLISDSVDAWRTRQYDQYQRVMNGIL